MGQPNGLPPGHQVVDHTKSHEIESRNPHQTIHVSDELARRSRALPDEKRDKGASKHMEHLRGEGTETGRGAPTPGHVLSGEPEMKSADSVDFQARRRGEVLKRHRS